MVEAVVTRVGFLRPGERIVVPDRQWELVGLSFAISWLGAYTTCQLLSHANSVGRGGSWLAWVALASLTFGAVSIWGLHFIAVLSASLDVRVELDVPLTVLSAALATFFTFAAFSSDSASSKSLGWWGRLPLSLSRRLHLRRKRKRLALTPGGGEHDDLAAEEGLLGGPPHSRHNSSSDELSAMSGDTSRSTPTSVERQVTERGRMIAGEAPIDPAIISAAGLDTEDPGEDNDAEDDEGGGGSSDGGSSGKPVRPPWDAASDSRTTPKISTSRPDDEDALHPDRLSPVRRRRSSASRASSNHSGSGVSRSRFSSDRGSTDQDLSSGSTPEGGGMPVSLNRLAKRRLISGAYRAPLSIAAFLAEIRDGMSWFIALKSLCWAAGIASMHHIGVAAVKIPLGRVHWEIPYNIAAGIIAFVVTCVACVCIHNMETQFSRQVLFSTVAACGVFAFHYTSMLGATYITAAPPEPNPWARGFPTQLPFMIVTMAILTCVLGSGLLAHSATLSRNRLAELVLTKRRMWRVIAEKEAVDRAAEVKQQYISSISHELRSPLFSVTGYAELLARTDMTEEQALYIDSVLAACSCMSMIISNVLDFSKLERGFAESAAKPSCVNPRTMMQALTRMTEDRTMNPGFHDVDVIVLVHEDVPETFFLDEAYVSRLLLNLLSNSLKFTQHGFILVTLQMEIDGRLTLAVEDSGSGIPKAFRPLLFEPYRQADHSLTRPHQGTGLGLSICKQLVRVGCSIDSLVERSLTSLYQKRLGGTIEYTSEEGIGETGTTFTVTVPVGDPTPPPPPPLGIKPRIAIAYRSTRTEHALRRILSGQGLSPFFVGAQSAAELAASADMVWCDLQSLDQSLALRQLLRTDNDASRPKLPIVVTTSTVQFEYPAGVETATNLILIRGPGIVLHSVWPMLANPEANYMKPVASVPSKVLRFAKLPSKEGSFEEESTSKVSPPLLSRNVMLVEDNAVNRTLGKRILEKMGYNVLLAENGKEAVELAKEELAEVILMDCQMPVLDGHGATRQIRALEAKGVIKRRPWIIALTANVTREAEERCKEDGFDLFLPKPLQFSRLREALDKYMP